MKKKILVICNESGIGGAEVSLISLLENLDKVKYQCIVILPGKGALYNRLSGKYCVHILPLTKFQKNKPLVYYLRTFFSVIGVALRISVLVIRQGIDLVYSNTVQAHVYAVLVRILTFKPVIWHVRDNVQLNVVLRLFVFFSSGIICVSRFIYDQVPAPTRKKVRIYNGVDTVYWSPGKKKPVSACILQSREAPLLVANVGQLVSWKKHEELVLAAERIIKSFDNVLFLVAGDDPDKDNRTCIVSLQRLIQQKRLEKYFIFCGFVKEIRAFLNNVDILLHCADGEPFGRVIIEAMSLEKAVVAYDAGGPAEIIVDQKSGILVEPGNIVKLANSILELLRDEQRRIKLGKQARQRVIGQFQSCHTAIQVGNIFETYLSNKKRYDRVTG